MSKYFIFALYLPLFQLILDVFILNTQELVFGWKVYDYVSYQRYRFSVRDQRCVSRRPSRHLHESSPGEEVVGSSFFDFELFRMTRSPRREHSREREREQSERVAAMA